MIEAKIMVGINYYFQSKFVKWSAVSHRPTEIRHSSRVMNEE